MSPTVHAVQGAVSAAVLYPFIGNDALLFGLAVFFIDLDHLIPFVRDCRSLDVGRFFAYHNAVWSYPDYLSLAWFHTAECMLLLWVLGYWRHEFRVVLAACLFHILFDVIKCLWVGRPFVRAYSFVEYALRRQGKRTRHTV